MDISKKIKDIRESKHKKQSEIADMLGWEQANYSRIERKGDKLTIEQIKQIAKALDVSLKEILFATPTEGLELENEKLKIKISHLEELLETKEKMIQLYETLLDKK